MDAAPVEHFALPCETIIRVQALYTLDYFQFATGFVFRGESHPFWEMVYVDSGVVDIGADGRTHTLMQGDILFHKPGEFHSIWANYAHAPNIAVVSFACASPAMVFFEGRRARTAPEHRQALGRMLREARQTFREPLDIGKRTVNPGHAGGVQMITLLLEQLLIGLLRSGAQESLPSRESAISAARDEENALERLTEHMRQNLLGTLRFRDLCRFAGLSATALKRLFSGQLGAPAMAYYEQIRMGEARRMLREQEGNVAQVAEALGFSSPSYFSTRFRRVTGMTPTDYVRSVRAD